MTIPQPSLSLTIRLTPEQLGFLAYLYPNEDPEIALIKLLDRARSRAISKAEQQLRVLNPDEDAEQRQVASVEEPVSHVADEFMNPIGTLQELCQKQQISLPIYEFEKTAEGFRCKVLAMGLKGIGEGVSKKMAKTEAARDCYGGLGDGS